MARSANLSKIQRRSDSPAHRTTRASLLGPLAAAVIVLTLGQGQIPTVIDALEALRPVAVHHAVDPEPWLVLGD